MPEPLKVFDNLEDATEAIQDDDERLEPPSGRQSGSLGPHTPRPAPPGRPARPGLVQSAADRGTP